MKALANETQHDMRPSPFLIAEVGVNHNGSYALAKDLVQVAKDLGADAVKFQTFKTAEVAHPSALRAPYQERIEGTQRSQVSLLQDLELSFEDFQRLALYCKDVGIEFMSTAFSTSTADFLAGLGQKRFKIPSGEITNRPLLRHIGMKGAHVLLSTGMSSLAEVEEALTTLQESGTPKSRITVLQCTSSYPAPLEEANLLAMVAMGENLGVSVGYSDHTVGEIAGGVAAALGATVIEKHITLDKNMPGPDHTASADPEEFRQYVEHIRRVVIALGASRKFVTQSELENRVLVRRSIFASQKIRKGELFTEENLVCLRPATGISAMEWDEVIGKVASKSFTPGDEITL